MFEEGGIQIIAVAQLLNAFVGIAIAIRLAFTYRKNPSVEHEYYMKFFLFIGLFFLANAGAQYIFTDPSNAAMVGVFNIVAFFFLNLGMGYLLSFPFLFTEKREIVRKIPFIVLIYSVVFTALRFVYFEPSVWQVFEDYAYWRPVFPAWMRILTGIFSVGTGVIVTYFFFRYGFINLNKRHIFRRSIILASGGIVTIFAGSAGFFAATQGNFSMLLIASLSSLAGFLIIMVGVYYKGSEVEDATS